MKRLGIFLALAITLPVLAQSKTVGSHEAGLQWRLAN